MEEDGNASSFIGTPYYMAPEILKKEKYTNKVDVFSTGCLLVHMLTGKTPFLNSHLNELAYAYRMRNDDLILEVPLGPLGGGVWETTRMYHFVSCMVENDPREVSLPVSFASCSVAATTLTDHSITCIKC